MHDKIVRVIKPHTAHGKWRKVNDEYTISRGHAVTLQLIGKVKILGAEGATIIDDTVLQTFGPLPTDDIDAAKAEYEAVFGKKPHHKMTAETIRAKIEEERGGK